MKRKGYTDSKSFSTLKIENYQKTYLLVMFYCKGYRKTQCTKQQFNKS